MSHLKAYSSPLRMILKTFLSLWYPYSAVFISVSRHVVVGAGLIMLVHVAIWYIPRHQHLQSVNQLRETGTRAQILIPALGHQFISIMDEKMTQSEIAAMRNKPDQFTIYVKANDLKYMTPLNQFLNIV